MCGDFEPIGLAAMRLVEGLREKAGAEAPAGLGGELTNLKTEVRVTAGERPAAPAGDCPKLG